MPGELHGVWGIKNKLKTLVLWGGRGLGVSGNCWGVGGRGIGWELREMGQGGYFLWEMSARIIGEAVALFGGSDWVPPNGATILSPSARSRALLPSPISAAAL
jgi:hypothetical protein